MVSSMHPTASEIGADILRQGGNAFDAAVAVGAAISVLSPDWAGPAGDSAWLLYDASKRKYHYLDGYSTCPAATTPHHIASYFGLDSASDLRSFQEEPPEQRHMGVVTSMIPGSPFAWEQLVKRFGKLTLEEVIDPAVEIAKAGFPVNKYLALAINECKSKILTFRGTANTLSNSEMELLKEGDLLRQYPLSETLKRFGRGGAREFYCGETAHLIVKHSSKTGGVIAREDLEGYSSKWRSVLHGSYRGKEVMVTSPPTAGAHVLQALNILENYSLRELPFHGEQALHLMIEALKLALADRRNSGGDPDFRAVDIARLIDKKYARKLSNSIDAYHAIPRGNEAYSGSSTTHFTVVDSMGSVVSATQSIGSRFGCGDTVEGTGLLMNDRTWWMSLADGPNQVSPGRRADIGHAPAIVAENGIPIMTLGSPGGFGIIQYVVQVIVNIVDYGLDIQRAIESPRFKIEDLAGRVGIEQRLNAETRKALVARGHHVTNFQHWTDRVGGVEGVSIDPITRILLGGYDPRRNSVAVGLN